MREKFTYKYRKEACTDIDTLEKMGAQDVIDRNDDMNEIDSTWKFNLKRFPYVLINKFKASFCAHGYQQLEGDTLFKTYYLVVQWTAVFLC